MKWEYKMISKEPHRMYAGVPNELAKAGGDGWELIAVVKTPKTEDRYEWIFKRPVEPS
jgi:hypothetical protein